MSDTRHCDVCDVVFLAHTGQGQRCEECGADCCLSHINDHECAPADHETAVVLQGEAGATVLDTERIETAHDAREVGTPTAPSLPAVADDDPENEWAPSSWNEGVPIETTGDESRIRLTEHAP